MIRLRALNFLIGLNGFEHLFPLHFSEHPVIKCRLYFKQFDLVLLTMEHHDDIINDPRLSNIFLSQSNAGCLKRKCNTYNISSRHP